MVCQMCFKKATKEDSVLAQSGGRIHKECLKELLKRSEEDDE